MERVSIDVAKQLFDKHFLGVEELRSVARRLGLSQAEDINDNIPYSVEELIEKKDTHLLFYVQDKPVKEGAVLSINYLKSLLGTDPEVSEPCFYNQDWYNKELFANKCTISKGWYLLRKSLLETSRGTDPVKTDLKRYPPALLVTYAYFTYRLFYGISLYDSDYVWCSDTDEAGDQVYVGRYTDPERIAKNGFSIHRHLSIKKNYGSIV